MPATAYVNATDLRSPGGRKPSADEYRYVREDNDYTAAQAALAPARLIPFAALISAIERRSHLWSRVWVDCSAILLTQAVVPLAATSSAELAQLSTLLKAWPADRLLWGSDTVPDALDQARRLCLLISRRS